MNNYEAIMKMNYEQLEALLDSVYCAGLNNGMYFSRQPEGQADEILDENPFDMAWLKDNAEPATMCFKCDDGDEYLLEAYTEAVLRNAGIDDGQNETNDNATVVLKSKFK